MLLLVLSFSQGCYSGHLNSKNTTLENDLLFAEFLQNFEKAVQEADVEAVGKMVRFPFIDYYGDIYHTNHSFSCLDFNEFQEKYSLIFDMYVIQAIHERSYRGYDKNFGFSGDPIGQEDYLLVAKTPERSKDLLFKKSNNQYYLTGIQYYE